MASRAGRRRQKMAERAVREYNRERNKIARTLGESYAPPVRSAEELLRNNPTLSSLRREIRNLEGIKGRSAKRIVKGEGGAETLTYTLKETERLNRKRNRDRETRRKKFGESVNQPGYLQSQERVRQSPKEVAFNERSGRSWESFLNQLGRELARNDSELDRRYKENYLLAIERELGEAFAKEVRELLKGIGGGELYMMGLRMDYMGVFSIDFPYSPTDVEDRINEIRSMLERLRNELTDGRL